MTQVREINVQTGEETVRDYTAEELDAIAAYVPPAAPVPQSVTPRQARLALLAAGHLAAVNAAVAAAGPHAQIDWDYALEIRRDNARIASMAAGLGLTDAQIDDLFRAAAVL